MFRAKRKDNREVVCGCWVYSKAEDKHFIVLQYLPGMTGGRFETYLYFYEIDPTTLSMKTTKIDKHNEMIYGSFEYEDGKMSNGGDELSNGSGRICKVRWHKWDCCWDAVPIPENNGKGNVDNFVPRAWNHCTIIKERDSE